MSLKICKICDRTFRGKWEYNRHMNKKISCINIQKQTKINELINEIKELMLIKYVTENNLSEKDLSLLTIIVSEKLKKFKINNK